MIFNSTNNKSKWLALGLIALTILVIVGIVLVVYFVNKNSQPINYTQIEINKEAVGDGYSFKVDNISFSDSDEDEYAILSVELSFSASKKLKFDNDSITVDHSTLINSNMPIKMAKGESVNATLSYKVKKGQELFLRYDIYKVALGMTI